MAWKKDSEVFHVFMEGCYVRDLIGSMAMAPCMIARHMFLQTKKLEVHRDGPRCAIMDSLQGSMVNSFSEKH